MRTDAEKFEKKTSRDVSSSGQQVFEKRIAHEWLTTKEASEYLGVSENALRIMVHRDQVAAYKFGRRLRFKLSDCAALFSIKGVQ